MMKRTGSYQVKPFSKNRRNIALLLEEGAQKHGIHALIEVDVTRARQLIRVHREKTGERMSFTGWIVRCASEAMARHRELNAYRHGRRKMVVFDDVDVSLPVERYADGEVRPMAYIIRKANEKNVREISGEIRKVQEEMVSSSTQILGQNLTTLERFALGAPAWIQRMLLWFLKRNGFFRKEHMGTLGVTSIGMFGKFPGWVVPLGIPAMLIVVGGITRKPGVVDDRIEIRERLGLTITVDHDMVDGGPLARFIDTLIDLMENAFGLEQLPND